MNNCNKLWNYDKFWEQFPAHLPIFCTITTIPDSSKILSVLYELFWFQLWIYVVRIQKMAPIDYN